MKKNEKKIKRKKLSEELVTKNKMITLWPVYIELRAHITHRHCF